MPTKVTLKFGQCGYFSQRQNELLSGSLCSSHASTNRFKTKTWVGQRDELVRRADKKRAFMKTIYILRLSRENRAKTLNGQGWARVFFMVAVKTLCKTPPKVAYS